MCPHGGRRPAGRPPRGGEVRFVFGAARPDQLPAATLPEIAFAGRSNVGKSSLLNRLVGRRGVARVSKTPGRTQQINFFAVDDQLMFVDLPGYGFARVPRVVQEQWRLLVERYLTSRRRLRAVVVIIDARRGLQPDDATLLDFLDTNRIAPVLVMTKIDKVRRSLRQQHIEAVQRARPGVAPIMFSAATDEGVVEVWKVLRGISDDR